MGRPRGFDEATVVRSAAELFSTRSYDGISMDDLVTHLGVHRNSLYKTFGSKRGLYLVALRWSLRHHIAPLVDRVAAAGDLAGALRVALGEPATEAGLNLLLMAAVERAPVDPEVADELAPVLAAFDQAARTAAGRHPDRDEQDDDGVALALTATILGLRLRARAGTPGTTIDQAGAALAHRLTRHT
ncbi:TetR/AcrR family transcriptional regulator [Nonomuraea roseoviolacea]|uniref:TetR/AcrR family transcriptional repressor of nem operon n=1 Tax=Nonomuraea roseoviolacea subsp. carminata TaxID=160689 RepID=A0ABT1JWJ9_9ACTN|nr:TetR/AcrR family transcriptional regulator [Nonomuraea roseoviolacea]MCP2345729.1 TetR/AcrR family transcriptional repressor of nem operon [Nonomuraea roseoviolacea subsp. carminata]